MVVAIPLALLLSSASATNSHSTDDECYMAAPRPVALSKGAFVREIRIVQEGNGIDYYGATETASFMVEQVNCEERYTQIVVSSESSVDAESVAIELANRFSFRARTLSDKERDELNEKGDISLKEDGVDFDIQYHQYGLISVFGITIEVKG